MHIPFFRAKGLCSGSFAGRFREGLVHQISSISRYACKRRWPISWQFWWLTWPFWNGDFTWPLQRRSWWPPTIEDKVCSEIEWPQWFLKLRVPWVYPLFWRSWVDVPGTYGVSSKGAIYIWISKDSHTSWAERCLLGMVFGAGRPRRKRYISESVAYWRKAEDGQRATFGSPQNTQKKDGRNPWDPRLP